MLSNRARDEACVVAVFLFSQCYGAHRALHSFPTRRSSDLTPVPPGEDAPVWLDRLLADGAVDELHVADRWAAIFPETRSEEHTSELQSPDHLVCRLLLEKKKQATRRTPPGPPCCRPPRSSSWPSCSPIARAMRLASSPYSFFLNATAPTALYTLSLHDALPISRRCRRARTRRCGWIACWPTALSTSCTSPIAGRRSSPRRDRKSTRLNSSHQIISYAVFCLKKKNRQHAGHHRDLPAADRRALHRGHHALQSRAR